MANRISIAAICLVSALGFATTAYADTVIYNNPPRPNTTVVVQPKPAGPVRAVVQAITQPDCDTTIKKTEGPRKTTTTVKKDCD